MDVGAQLMWGLIGKSVGREPTETRGVTQEIFAGGAPCQSNARVGWEAPVMRTEILLADASKLYFYLENGWLTIQVD